MLSVQFVMNWLDDRCMYENTDHVWLLDKVNGCIIIREGAHHT